MNVPPRFTLLCQRLMTNLTMYMKPLARNTNSKIVINRMQLETRRSEQHTSAIHLARIS